MRILERFRRWAARALTLSDPALRNIFKDAQTFSGVTINEHTALNFAAVWAAVRVISEDVATLPLFLYRRLGEGGKERAPERRQYRLVHDEPNPEMTAVSFREALTAHVLLWGNAYAEIERNGLNEPVALWPILPNRVTPERARTTKALIYRVRRDNGTDVMLTPNEMLHIAGLGFDGVQGYSVISKARESLGVAVAAERYAATFFGKGGRPGIVLEHPMGLRPDAIDRIKADWKRLYGGPEMSNEIAVLEEGMKLHDFGIPQKDMQFLEQRKFGITEVARWFRVPPHKIMDLERATFSNIENQDLDYFKSSLRPWLVRWEQELNRKLIPSLERTRFIFEHLEDALLRGDALTRAQALQVQRQNGIINADEWREIENRNPLPNGEGKVYLINAAMQTIEDAKAPKPAVTPPQLNPPQDDEDEDERARQLAMVHAALARTEALAVEIRAAVLNGHSAPEKKPDPIEETRRTDAHRELFADVLGRMVRREVKAIRKRLRRSPSRGDMLEWAVGFYATHAELVCESVRAAVVAHLAEMDSDANAGDVAKSLAERYVADALEQLRATEDTQALMVRWETQRAQQVASAIVEGPTHAIW
jgi:HK97 family phage portal protein